MARPKYPVKSLLKSVVDWFGKSGRPNSPSYSIKTRLDRALSGTHACSDTYSDDELWEMLFTPYVWAGLRFRDVSRLWTGAGPTYNKNGDQTSNAQIIAKDTDGKDIESEQLDACRWLFDQRITRSFKQVLEEISYSKLVLKKSVHEIKWVKQTEGEHAGKIVIDDFISVDPTLFTFNPQGYAPGLYLQEVNSFGVRTASYMPVDERRFLVVTNHALFSDKNGISELEPLRKAEPRRADAEKSWGRGAQRHGHGHLLGYYGAMLRGASASTDRDSYKEALQQIGSDTVTMLDESNRIEALDVNVNAEVFKQLIDEFKAQISVVLTGSTSTLLDEAGGTKARLETSETSQESQLEQQDCADISAAVTEQVLRRFCDFNAWPTETEVYPKMQLITEELLAPTMSETQETQTDILDSTDTTKQETETIEKVEIVKESKILKLQEEDERKPPASVPVGWDDFPSSTTTPEQFQAVSEYATRYLENNIEAKPYSQLDSGEGADVFTIKRLRSFDQEEAFYAGLKAAIIPTLTLDNEAQAWEKYYADAISIFQSYSIDMTPDLRDDLLTSFRQTRQNAYAGGLLEYGKEQGAVGIRIKNLEDGHQVRLIHRLWNDKVIPIDHVELQAGGRLRTPLDFGCLCFMELVYDAAEITAESDWPEIFPGKSFKYYKT